MKFCITLIAFGISFLPLTLSASSIEIWARGPGNYADKNDVPRIKHKKIELKSLKSDYTELFDFQYNGKRNYQSVNLEQLIKAAGNQYSEDTVMLHFHNGMIIPVPNTEVWRGKIRLATAYCATKKKCSNDFPKIEKYQEQEIYRDPRPIAFEGNKIVVGEKSLPELQGVSSTFSPWLHATSLIGVEFVNIEPYFKQFDFGESAGLEVFRHRCQYCHGVRGVGASLGWDYVDPLPVYTLRTAETLLNHVKNKKMQALERGLLMPNQKDVSQQEAKALWQWMKAAATNKIRNYKP